MFLKNSGKFIGKHLCCSVFFNKFQAWGINFVKSETLAPVIPKNLRDTSHLDFPPRLPASTSQLDFPARLPASKFLFRLFSLDLLIFFLRVSKLSQRNGFFHSLLGYFERLCFFVCWILIHWVIIVVCFWQYVFNTVEVPLCKANIIGDAPKNIFNLATEQLSNILILHYLLKSKQSKTCTLSDT